MQILPGNEAWNRPCWERRIQDKVGAKAFLEAVFGPFQGPSTVLSREGTRALRASTLTAIPPPPPGSNIFPTDLPDDLSTAGIHELVTVILNLVEGYTQLPQGSRPNRRVIVEELLPVLEGLTGIPKCLSCLYPSTHCECGGGQPQGPQVGLPQAPRPAPTSTTLSSLTAGVSTLSQGATLKVTPVVPSMGPTYSGALLSPTPPRPPHPNVVWNPESGWLDMRPTYERLPTQHLLQIQQGILQSIQAAAAPGAVASQPVRHLTPPQPGRPQPTAQKADPPKGMGAPTSGSTGSTSTLPSKGGSIVRGRGRGVTPITSKSDRTEPKALGPDDQEWSQSQGHHRHPKSKSSASGDAGASSSWAEANLRMEVHMSEGDQGEETHLISQMDTTEEPLASEEPLPGPLNVEDSGPPLSKSEGWRVDFTTILKYFM